MPSKVWSKVEEALNKLAGKLAETHDSVEIYLFGSFAKGEWLEDSDIDIIVVSESFEGIPMPERINMIRKLAAKDLAFEILAYTPKELMKATTESIAVQDASTYWKK
jgi:hypothetical protein